MKNKHLAYKVGSFLEIKKRSLENQRLYCGGFKQPLRYRILNSIKSLLNFK